MDSKAKKVMVKQSKTSIEQEKLKVTTSSIDIQSVQVADSSMEVENVKLLTSSTQSVQLTVNKPLITKDSNNTSISAPVIENAISDPVVEQYDPISTITKKKEIWKLGVIIDDIWTVFKANKEDHVDMVLRDVMGGIIQATIMEHELKTWNERHLFKGKTYCMRNFKVHDNDNGFKFSNHKFRLLFAGATRVKEIEIPGIPLNAFLFKDFLEITSGNYQPDLLVDAIGVVDTLKKCVAASATKKANVGFTMKDIRDNIIDCTLWDGLSAEFLSFYNERPEDVPPVLIIKNAKVKEANGIFPLQLTNAWNGTRLMYNRDIAEIIAFTNSLPKDATYPSQQFSAPYSSQYPSQSSMGSQLTSDEKFIKQGQIMQLVDMKKFKEDTFCVTVATTDHILINNTGWYFRSCPDCGFKANGSEPPFICKSGHKTDEPILKYKLDVEVEDGSDVAKFVFWDNTLTDLLGINVNTLYQQEKMRGYGDPQEFPTELDAIMERKFAFRVKWSPTFGGQASVLEVQDNPELIARILEQLPAAESACKEIVAIEEEPVDISDSPPSQKFTQSDIDKFASLDDSILSTPNFTTSKGANENETSASSHKSPGKRSASKNVPVDSNNLEGQFSSTRSGKIIKKEKI